MMVALGNWTVLVTLILCVFMEMCSSLLPKVGRTNLISQAAKYTAGNQEEEDAIANEFEKNLLNMFGLSKRPNPPADAQIPRIMQHLFKAHMGGSYVDQHNLISDWEVGFDLPPQDITSRVNTARGFHHIDEDEYFPGLPDHHVRLRFDVTTLPKHESIGSSELLLHRQAITDYLTASSDETAHRINIYEIIKMPSRPSKLPVTPITRLLDTRVIDARNSTWERFNVGVAASRWKEVEHDDNLGLIVEVVRDSDGQPPQAESKKHVRMKRDHFSGRLDDWTHVKPLLLMYNLDQAAGSAANLEPKQRRRRSSRKRDTENSRKKRRKRRRRNCQRQELYVDFGDVGWDDWIVAPHGYNAFYCQGQCPFPLSEHLNATNHAIVQTLMNSVDSSSAPKPCCVPTELSSISMLYMDEYDQVVLKTYQQMVVEACGCR